LQELTVCNCFRVIYAQHLLKSMLNIYIFARKFSYNITTHRLLFLKIMFILKIDKVCDYSIKFDYYVCVDADVDDVA